eukprot:129184_1
MLFQSYIFCLFLLIKSEALPSCIKSSTVVHDYNITSLSSDGWIKCYFEPYSTYTTATALISNCPVGDNIYLFVGALQTPSNTTAYMGAFAPSEVIASYKQSLVNAYTPHGLTAAEYNVYWYNHPGAAFGFAPSS